MGHPAFRSGRYDTHFVRDLFKPEFLEGDDPAEREAAALVAGHWSSARERTLSPARGQQNGASPWKLRRR
jgi:hypothetical protein